MELTNKVSREVILPRSTDIQASKAGKSGRTEVVRYVV